jgi:hypothetical protein
LNMLTERFWAKVSKSGGCWNWAGAINNRGNGQVHLHGKTVLAHRASFEAFNGPVRNGLWVLHRCDNRRCVNPDHLFLGDGALDMQDCASKGRLHFQKAPRCGEKHSQAKLTARQVAEMRELYKSGRFTKKELAGQFRISETQAGKILRHEAWRCEAAA